MPQANTTLGGRFGLHSARSRGCLRNTHHLILRHRLTTPSDHLFGLRNKTGVQISQIWGHPNQQRKSTIPLHGTKTKAIATIDFPETWGPKSTEKIDHTSSRDKTKAIATVNFPETLGPKSTEKIDHTSSRNPIHSYSRLP